MDRREWIGGMWGGPPYMSHCGKEAIRYVPNGPNTINYRRRIGNPVN